MILRACLIVAFGLTSLWAIPATADDLRVVAHFNGTCEIFDPGDGPFCDGPGNVCEGDLLTCATGEEIAVCKLDFFFMDGICDDGDPNVTDCDGRFRDYDESCRDRSRDQVTNFNFSAIHARGAYRVCFDDTGSGDCSGSTPAGTIIETGRFRTQARFAVDEFSPFWADTGVLEKSTFEFFDPVDGLTKETDSLLTVSHVSGKGDEANPDEPQAISGTVIASVPPAKKKGGGRDR
mgnify:CR=1 FL=1